jgi:3'(2'), 5'-bisphosphate nucleotidase
MINGNMKNEKIKELLKVAIRAGVEAGSAVCEVYNNEFDVEFKDDKSPLTLADTNANKIIESYLEKTEYPILSEEGRDIPYSERRKWEYFWMVDPLDGTKEFVKRNGEFKVNIALIHNGTPVLGVVVAPVLRDLYFASELTGAVKVGNISMIDSFLTGLDELMKSGTKLPVDKSEDIFRVMGSKSHMTKETESFIRELEKEYANIEIISKGSSLKICMVAEGYADVYPRFAPTMEWDTAAGHAIVKYAGGEVINRETDKPVVYNKENLLNPWFLVTR